MVTEALSLMGSYAYTDAELTDDAPCLLADLEPGVPSDPEQCAADDTSAFDGDRLPATPEHQAFVAVNYGFDLAGGSQIDFDWSVTYTSDVLTKVGERNFGESLDSFSVHNASATWFTGDVAITLYADNVFDEYAETGVRDDTSEIRQYGEFDSRRYFKNVIRPRQVGMRFVYNFEN